MKLIIPTVPVAQPRQRHAVIGGHIRNYTPTRHPVNAFKAALMVAVKQEWYPRPCLEGPVRLEVDYYLPRPKRLTRKSDPSGPIPHTAKPDTDNLLKSTKDALSGLIWRDDAQVCWTFARKWYAEKDGVPRVEITVEEIGEATA